MSSHITITDQFCGAGGSSLGAVKAAQRMGLGSGLEIKLALNHWRLAIETHNTNFPDTIHECTDISACDPRRYPRTTGLITSPECTNHSLAKGQRVAKAQIDLFDSGKLDPAAERSRATMWDVPRFAEYHQYQFIVVENVVDARKWVMWDAWLMAMHCLGYQHRCVYHNSQHHHPTPQSRDRMYVVFWKKGNRAPDLEYKPDAWCINCSLNVNAFQSWRNPEKKFGKYKQQYDYRCPQCHAIVEPYYYAAFNCIDWTDIGTRIGDRQKPLSPNTIRRIEYGLKKYGTTPIIFHRAYSDHARGVVRPVTDRAFTQTTLPTQAIAVPFIVNDQHSTGIDCRVKMGHEPLSTIPTVHQMKLVTPFIIKGEHTMREGYARAVGEPCQTQTVRQSMAMVIPWIIEMNRTGEAKTADHPTATITAGGINHAILASPIVVTARGQSMAHSSIHPLTTQSQMINHGIVTNESFNSFISYYYGNHQASGINESLGSCTTRDRHQLLTYKEPAVEDCYYRMLKPHEIQAAMAFDTDYVILGSGKDKVKQLGNAVTPPVMTWLIERCIESLV